MSSRHHNSIASFYAESYNDRETMIIQLLKSSTVPLTCREIADRLGFTDGNAVKPRISMLLKRGQLVECGDVHDPVTNRTVMTVRLAERQPSSLFL